MTPAERAKRWALANPDRYRENQRKWREQNREKPRAYNAAYRKINASRIKQRRDETDPCRHQRYHKARYAKPDYVAKARERAKKQRQAHPDKCRERVNEWKRSHPIEAKAIARTGAINRRARERSAGKISVADLRDVRTAARCAHCGMTNPYMEVDHIRPLSRGGTNHRSNLQLLCRPCNRRKHAKYQATV